MPETDKSSECYLTCNLKGKGTQKIKGAQVGKNRNYGNWSDLHIEVLRKAQASCNAF